MANRLVHWGSAVDFVVELPAVGNAIGDTRLVCYPPGGVRATPYTWNGTAWRPYNDPLTGTHRLYVDGSNGNDSNTGASWAQAWRTWGRIYQTACSILSIEPNGLALILNLRGTFAEAIRGAFYCCGSSRPYVVHAIDDFTTQRTGTVTGVDGEAPVPKHGLSRLTLNVAPALDGTELGMTLRLDDPITGSRGTCTIVRVDVPNQYVWVSQAIGEFPAWVLASPANAIVCTPSAYTPEAIDLLFLCSPNSTTGDFSLPAVVGLRCGDYCTIHGNVQMAAIYCRSLAGTWKWMNVNGYGNNASARYERGGGTYYLTDALASEFGMIKGPTPTTNCRLGNACDYLSIVGVVSFGGGFSGYANARCGIGGGCSWPVNNFMSVGYGYCLSTFGEFKNCISRGTGGSSYGAMHCHIGSMKVSKVSFLDLPAAGINALFRCEAMGAKIDVSDANIEGANEGTGADLKVAHVKSGEIIFRSGFGAGLYSKHRQFVTEEGGSIVCRGAVTFGSNPGGGPDMYSGPRCLIEFQDAFTKSAVNSETAIQNGVDGQITAATKRFTSATAVFTSAHVGRSIKIANTVNPGNVGVHEITAFVDANNVTLNNMAAPVNEGPGLTWGLVGTPRPIFEVARGGRISQTDGKTFTVRIPEVEPAPGSGVQEWSRYGYGLAHQGFAHIHEGGEVVLGTLALSGVGAAGAGGIAAKIKNGSKLIHKGGAVILGAAPLDLGGNAAAAWPATTVNDNAAGAPQGCMVIANVP